MLYVSDMETLEGFPSLPTLVRAEQSSAAPHATDMETLEGFPSLPTLVRAEQSSAAPHATCRVLAFGLCSLALAACGTAPPAAPAATPAAPLAAVVAAPAPVAPAEPVFAAPSTARAALVASLVTVAPAKIIGDLDALSRRLELPMMLGRELLTAIGGMGLLGDSVRFNAFWDRLDPAAPVAVVWVLPPKSPSKGFCTALTFRNAAAARRTFEEMGAPGAARSGVSERRTPDGDVLWGGVKGRTLFVSNSAEALLLAGGLAEAAQVAPTTGQIVATVLPPALIAASGKTRDALVAEAASMLAREAGSGQGLATPAFQRMVVALMEAAAKLALDSSVVRLVLEAGPHDGFMVQSELVPAAGTDFAARTARRSPYAFDAKLPVRDDSTVVVAIGNPTDWISMAAKAFEATGPAGQELWRNTNKMLAATGEWSCVFDSAEAGFATLCSSTLKPGTNAKAELDAAVALVKAQQAWEAEIYGQKLSPLKIKRTGGVAEIEKKIENRDKTARDLAKALAGGDTVRTALTVKDGRLLQATGREARKTLAGYGASGSGKGAPLVAAALARTQGAEGMASVDVVSMVLRVLGKAKDLPGSQMVAVAAALPGMAGMKAPFLFTLRGGPSLTGDFRIPLGSLENVAKVVRGMFGPAGAGPSK